MHLTNVIIAFPKIEDAKSMKNLLLRSGYPVLGACSTGAQAIGIADGLNAGILICAYKLPDMMYTELIECLPEGFEVLLMASPAHLREKPSDQVICLSMPLKVHELISTLEMLIETVERRKRKKKNLPKERNREDREILEQAKSLLRVRNNMTEEEAHRYIQKCSMDSGTNMVETAQMILTVMQIS